MVGIVSAILLILTLITGELAIIFPHFPPLKYVSAGSALLGFFLVIVAAIIVMVESSIVGRQLEGELLDVPELAQCTGLEVGNIAKRRPR